MPSRRPTVRPLTTVRVVVALVALALGGFAIGTTEFVTMGLLPDIADGVGVDIPSAGHVISAYALGVVVGAPVIAALSARLPRKALLMGLMAAFLLGNVLTAARARLPHPAGCPVRQRPAARRLLRRRLAGRRLARGAATCAGGR